MIGLTLPLILKFPEPLALYSPLSFLCEIHTYIPFCRNLKNADQHVRSADQLIQCPVSLSVSWQVIDRFSVLVSLCLWQVKSTGAVSESPSASDR